MQLADFVVEDLRRLSRREVIEDVERWREAPEPASVIVESPVYRKEVGLWEHQKQFVKLAFDEHRGPHGARFILADQVGLGKTLQLAMAAQLMALVGDKPVLILVPKSLLQQWQEELDALLGLPSAIWQGTRWIDEHGIEHPARGEDGIRRCPRRIGIVSTGLITSGSETVVWLENMRFECVIVDEAHRARRRNLNPKNPYGKGQPNNLLEFIRKISPRTKSLLLATATPVQLHAIEAYDLLDALAQGSDAVLGGPGSVWRKAKISLPVLLGTAPGPDDLHEQWEWLRNPFPPASEGLEFAILRRSLGLTEEVAYADGRAIDKLRAADKRRIESGFRRLKEHHNPYIRRIVVRTREYLENEIDPETGEPYLTRVEVRLHGESEADAIRLPPFLQSAYELAEEFCALLKLRVKSGFFRTMLLKRIGSTMEAGRRTTEKILNGWEDIGEDEDDENTSTGFRTLTGEERGVLERLAQSMEAQSGAGSQIRGRATSSHRERVANARMHHLQPVLRFSELARWPADDRTRRRTDRSLCRRQSVGGDAQRNIHTMLTRCVERRGAQTHGPAAARDRRCIRGAEPSKARDPDQPGPAMEPIATGAAQRTNPTNRAGSTRGRHLQHALRRIDRRSSARAAVEAVGEYLATLRSTTGHP